MQPLPDDIAHYRLLMLNLHGVISCAFKLEQIFRDLRRKLEGDYVYGRKFVTDAALDITETLGMLFFYLNALNRGRDVGLFHVYDELKKQISKCIDENDSGDSADYESDQWKRTADPISGLLGMITDYTVEGGLSDRDSLSGRLEPQATISDILNYCYDRAFDMLDSLLGSAVAAESGTTASKGSVIGIPTSYLIKEKQPIFERPLFSGEPPDVARSNRGASRLLEGIYDVDDDRLYEPFVERPRNDTLIRGILIYSNETLALYYLSGKFRNIVGANVCDAVGGNHISLLIGPAVGADLPSSSHQLVKRLLDWLDFHTFAGHGFVIASIRGITRGETENHLSMLGKLLSFVSSTRIPPSDDKAVDRNTEIFLENII